MKTSRNARLLTILSFAIAGLVLLALTVLPAKPGTARSGGVPVLQTTPSPLLDSEVIVVRAYYDDYQMVHDLSTWTEPWEVYSDLGFVVLGVNRADLDLLQVLGFRVEIDEEATRALAEPRPIGPQIGYGGYPTIPGYACYRTVEGTYMTAEDLAAAFPTLAKWVDVGDSWEKTQPGGAPGFDMMVLVLTNQQVPGPKPALFVTSSIHAREYTPAELMTRFAETLLTGFGSDPDATWILDHHEIHLMLHANPDGRKWAETGFMWRKNTDNDFCTNSNLRGADLNRNFSFQWGCCNGSSGSQCSEVYRGSGPASEPETQAVQEYLRAIFPDQRADHPSEPAPADATGIYLDIHSYGKLILWPWGYTANPAPNATGLQTLGRKFAFFNGYTPTQAVDLYITDGTTDDFGYGDLGVASYTFEIGTAFFQSCAYFDNTLIPDNMPALLYAAKTVRTPYLTPAGPDALDLSLSAATVSAGTPITLTATLNDMRYNNSEGTEPVQAIAAAEYSIDVPYWDTAPVAYPMDPADGNFNTAVEDAAAVLDTTGLSPGRHIVYVRGQDAAGNWGAVSAIFLWIEPPGGEIEIYLPVVVRD
ncbi:MAG TPA: M14 family metallopeptidase [Anaerolineales bacterium]|nr:M14 family metallopeptidase [Anaerolineales bacterium]